MRTSWVVGNWKMNGGLIKNKVLIEALSLVKTDAKHKLAICVPYPYLAQAQHLLKGSSVILVAQNASQFDAGAYTGEVSVSMLKEFSVRMVLVGHSERRRLFAETNSVVAAKAKGIVSEGLSPIVCFGETLEERHSGLAKTTILAQFKAVADVLGSEGLARCVLAYEPIWAIGTGKVASSAEAQEVHAWLRAALSELGDGLAERVSILYGGSVNASNAAEIFDGLDVDGGLVGGASLAASEFIDIYRAVF